MAETQTQRETELTPQHTTVHPARLIVFAVMSFGFLMWVLFGQVEARVWVSGQLTMLDRRIASMWYYLGNNLPNLPLSSGITMVYWLSITFIVVGTVAGLWLFLGTADDDPNDPPIDVIQAAHLTHENE